MDNETKALIRTKFLAFAMKAHATFDGISNRCRRFGHRAICCWISMHNSWSIWSVGWPVTVQSRLGMRLLFRRVALHLGRFCSVLTAAHPGLPRSHRLRYSP